MYTPGPQPLADLFDTGVRIVRHQLWVFLAVTALIGVPMGLLADLLPRLFADADGLSSLVLQLVGSFALLATLGSALQLGLARAAGQALAGQAVTALGSYRLPPSRYGALLLAMLPPVALRTLIALICGYTAVYVRALLGAPGLLLLIGLALVGLLVLWARLLFVPQLVALEGCGPRQSLRCSVALAEPRLGRVWLALAALESLNQLLVLAPVLVPRLLNSFVLMYWLSWIDTIYYILLTLLLAPVKAAVYTALYYDLRARSEGTDLARRISIRY